MEIRLAALDDVEPICLLYNEFFEYNASLQPEYYKSGIERGGYPESVIKDAKSDIIVAVESGAIVGFIHIRQMHTPPFDSLVQHTYAEINDFITTAKYRRMGIGTELMNAAKQWAVERSLGYIELFVLSNAKNEVRFYEHNEFETVSHTMRCQL